MSIKKQIYSSKKKHRSFLPRFGVGIGLDGMFWGDGNALKLDCGDSCTRL